MIKDVVINIQGVQGLDGDSDTVEFATVGRLGYRDGKCFLSYDEGQIIEGGNVKTKIIINSPNSVVLQRNGDINSRMEIEAGQRRCCFYGTPIGEISIGIYGETVENNLTENGGTLRLSYTIDSDLKLISRNEVSITVKEV